MSTSQTAAPQNHCATLASDPTHTEQIRERFRQEISGRFRTIRGKVRKWVGYQEDIFELSTQAAEPPDVFRFDTDPAKRRAFLEWLREQIRQDILEPVSMRDVRQGKHWTATHIRSSYGRGWRTARSRLRNEGVSVGPKIDTVFDLPIARRQLRKLYTRTFQNLESVTKATAPAVRDELTRGLAEGWNPKKTARKLTDEIEDIEHTRAETLARSETINSHSTATLDRFEDVGVDVVKHGEWDTAGDDRVCPICESLDGDEFTTEEMRTGTFEFEPSESEPDYLAGTYRLKPPAHPNGRCAILPVV